MIGATLVLLLAESLLGIYVNLFVPTPHGQPVLSAAGMLFLFMACNGCERYLSGGGHDVVDSYTMAARIVLATACCVVARHLDRRSAA